MIPFDSQFSEAINFLELVAFMLSRHRHFDDIKFNLSKSEFVECNVYVHRYTSQSSITLYVLVYYTRDIIIINFKLHRLRCVCSYPYQHVCSVLSIISYLRIFYLIALYESSHDTPVL